MDIVGSMLPCGEGLQLGVITLCIEYAWILVGVSLVDIRLCVCNDIDLQIEWFQNIS